MRIITANLLGSWPSVKDVPKFEHFEIALIGRSNVGKSTFINSLVGRKALAKVSATPGKTQLAVLFEVEIEDQGVRRKIVLTDLPGFGFAKVGKEKQKDFHKLIVEYISKRKELNAICLLNDCRREPGEDELLIWQAAKAKDLKTALIVTKVDKLGSNAKRSALSQLAKYYPRADCVVGSGTNEDKASIQSQLFGQLLSASSN